MSASGDENLAPEDLALLSELRAGNDWMRALLATLARRGAAFRLAQPERARAWLEALATFPYYKAGQFLFDLLEWEDFMLDEPAGILEAALDPQSMRRISASLRSLRAHLDGAAPLDRSGEAAGIVVRLEQPAELPPLAGGFYLYPDVVLGIIAAALPLAAGRPYDPPGVD